MYIKSSIKIIAVKENFVSLFFHPHEKKKHIIFFFGYVSKMRDRLFGSCNVGYLCLCLCLCRSWTEVDHVNILVDIAMSSFLTFYAQEGTVSFFVFFRCNEIRCCPLALHLQTYPGKTEIKKNYNNQFF